MANKRTLNALSQMRINVSHMRSLESAVRNDFDELFSSMMIGYNKSYVVRGFEISMSGAINSSATALTMLVADSSILHGSSATSGTFLVIPSGSTPESLNSSSNPKVSGTFTASAENYVTIDLSRAIDSSTSSLQYFFDVANKVETTRVVPEAEVLNYTIKISTIAPSSTDLPVAIIRTKADNSVESIEDIRPMLYRLATGGSSSQDPFYSYEWNDQTEGREENPVVSSDSSINPFRGGDKQLSNMKVWMNAVMSCLKEIKGTTYWYDFNVGGSNLKLREDIVNTVFTGRGSVSHDKITAGKINWEMPVFMRLISSRLYYKILANVSSSNVVLQDGQVAYLDIVRDQDITPRLIWTNGSPIVSSVGGVDWTDPDNLNLRSGDWIKIGSDDYTQCYQILAVDSNSQVTLSSNFSGTSTGSSGLPSKYSFGIYETNSAPHYTSGVSRHIFVADKKDVPLREDIYWLFFRDDTEGYTPRVYSRMNGSELSQGSSSSISEELTQNIVSYIGAISNASDGPDYDTSIGQKEVTRIFCVPASDITTGQYFLINDMSTGFYPWFNKSSGGGDPLVAGRTAIPTAITSTDSETQVAEKLKNAFNLTSNFTATRTNNLVYVTAVASGNGMNAMNVDVGGAFGVQVITEGDVSTKFGQTSYNSNNLENLTARCTRLTSMMADKAQDKTIKMLADYYICSNTTNSSAQEITFTSNLTNTLKVAIPSSDNNGSIGLGNTLSLLVNQVAYFVIDRNGSFTISNLSGLTVANIEDVPLTENIFVFAYRLGSTTAWLWDGKELSVGVNYSDRAMSDILRKLCYDESYDIVSGGTDGELKINLLNSSGDLSYVGDTESSVLWGAALENSSSPSYYKPVNTSIIDNKITHPEDISSVSWVKSNTSVTTNVATAPNGTMTADKLHEDSSISNHRLLTNASFSLAVGQKCTFSVFLKSDERTAASVKIGAIGSMVSEYVTVSLVDGSVILPPPNYDYSVETYPNGWFRVSITGEVINTDMTTCSPYVELYNGNTGYEGDGSSGIFVWGAQLEQTLVPSYYIPATTTMSNLLPYPENFGHSSWEKTSLSIVSSTDLDPATNTTASYVSVFSDDSEHSLITRAPFTQGDVYTFSTFLKSQGTGKARITLPSSFFGEAYADFNLSTGTIISSSGLLSGGVISMSDSWKRVYITAIASLSGSEDLTDEELPGPIPMGDNVTIPKNSRDSNVQQTYIVGSGCLQICLNGQVLRNGVDYFEVGVSGASSSVVTFAEQIEANDVLSFRILKTF